MLFYSGAAFLHVLGDAHGFFFYLLMISIGETNSS
jgi:hypothetical protein